MSSGGYVLTALAEDDLIEIADWLNEGGPAFLDAAYAAFARLGRFPGLGHARPDLTARSVRFWPLRRRYLVIYREAAPIEILRVLSAYRDVAALLAPD